MKTAWYKGLEKDAQDEIKLIFKSSTVLRDRLDEMIASKVNAKIKETMSNDAYDNANWAYRQADSQGYLRALKEISSLLD